MASTVARPSWAPGTAVPGIRARAVAALSRRWMARVAADPAALRATLGAYRDGEDNGEAAVFEQVGAHLPARYVRMCARHAADEARHAALFAAAVDALGGAAPTPARLDPLARLDAAAGGLLATAGDSREALGRVFLLLMAFERRLAERLPLIADGFAAARPELSALFRTVARDEARHIRYCTAVSQALIPDPDRWATLRDEAVAVEARAFAPYLFDFLNHILDIGLRQMPWWERLGFRLMARLGRALGRPLPVGGAP